MSLENVLKPYQRFGVNLGLDRIIILLELLGNPHRQVPIIHVAGTNGKGSVCAYLASVLQEAGYKVGRYTSPHLINWTERIQINHFPIPETEFIDIFNTVEAVIQNTEDPPTLFEIVTAIAWLYFAQSKVDIAVIEVGLGGRLDATNVCDNSLVSVITSISREHWQVLGNTLSEIAAEKAGILKFNCPAVIGQLPPEAEEVIKQKIETLHCPTIWVEPATRIDDNLAEYKHIKYTLPLLGDIQLINSALAIAALSILQQQGWQIPTTVIEQGMAKTQWLGRLQWIDYQNRRILVDGAHNPAAAQGLAQYVHGLNQPVTWVMGMLSTKDHREILQTLLRKGDNLYLVPVPDHSTANPEELAQLALEICPCLAKIKIDCDVFFALKAAIHESKNDLIVLCGSLYLVGYFLKQLPHR